MIGEEFKRLCKVAPFTIREIATKIGKSERQMQYLFNCTKDVPEIDEIIETHSGIFLPTSNQPNTTTLVGMLKSTQVELKTERLLRESIEQEVILLRAIVKHGVDKAAMQKAFSQTLKENEPAEG